VRVAGKTGDDGSCDVIVARGRVDRSTGVRTIQVVCGSGCRKETRPSGERRGRERETRDLREGKTEREKNPVADRSRRRKRTIVRMISGMGASASKASSLDIEAEAEERQFHGP